MFYCKINGKWYGANAVLSFGRFAKILNHRQRLVDALFSYPPGMYHRKEDVYKEKPRRYLLLEKLSSRTYLIMCVQSRASGCCSYDACGETFCVVRLSLLFVWVVGSGHSTGCSENSGKLLYPRFLRGRVQSPVQFPILARTLTWCSSAGKCTITVWVGSSKTPCDISWRTSLKKQKK